MTGVYQVLPIICKNDQNFNVILDNEGKFLRLEETMPPMVNFYRLQMPWRHEELAMRKAEWAELEAARFKNVISLPDGGYVVKE